MKAFAEVVEATILDIEFSQQAKSFKLKLLSPWNGQQIIFHMGGIREMSGCDIKLNNIIDRIEVFEGSDFANCDLTAEIAFAVFGRSEVPKEIYDVRITELTKVICENNLKLIRIDAVYGADFVVIAEVVQVESNN